MRKILFALLSFLLVSGLKAQLKITGTAEYRLEVSGSVGRDRNPCPDSDIYGLREIIAHHQDGKREVFFSGRLVNRNFNESYLYTTKNRVISVEFFTINHYLRGWFFGVPICNREPNNKDIPITSPLDPDERGRLDHELYDLKVESIAEIKFNIEKNKNYLLGSTENLQIELPDHLEAADFDWTYQVGGSRRKSVPYRYNKKAVLDIPAKDLSLVLPRDYGKTIYLWVEDHNFKRRSNTLSFAVLPSAPYITSVSASNVKCSDSEDGTAQITFERKLYSNEKLEILVNRNGLSDSTRNATNILLNNTSYTLEGLKPGKYTLTLSGTYLNENSYTDNPTRHKASFEIKKPDPVKINAVSKTDVFCHGGEDGKIDLSISGGTGTYQYTIDSGETWNNFSSKNPFSIKNLKKGTYQIKVRDSNACMAKNEQGGEKTIEQEITEPEFPVSLSNIVLVTPTGYGLKNGYISLRITGGTPYDDGSYSFEWKKQGESKSISKNITTDALGEPFTVKVDSLSKGTYVLTVKDKNHAGSTSKSDKCGIISRTFTLEDPDLLTVSIAQEKAISCHIDNEYDFKMDLNGNGIPDEAEDGILRTSSSGGVGAYAYQWQKSQNGEFVNIPSANASSLEKVTAGNYRVVITDTKANSATSDILVQYPSKMNIYLDASEISCNDQNSGVISARVEGGSGGYSYLWNTSDKEAVVRDLSAGSYFLNVKDSKGCTVSKSMEIDQPGGLEIEDLFVNDPSCFGAENGAIGVNISGGKAPYALEWSNGMKTTEISGLKKGVYTLRFTDANGCSSFKEYTLKDPEKLNIKLAEHITLCSGDSQEVDVKIEDPHASYLWKDASGNILSQDSSMVLSSAGTYLVEITSSKGCSAQSQITVERSSAVLNPAFLMPSHAYKEKSVKLVNISTQQAEKLEWIIPQDQDIRVVSSSEESLELVFSKEGAYKIGMKGSEGKCEKTMYKNILIEENLYGPEPDPFGPSNILEFEISSPINEAEHHISIRLEKEAPIKLRMVNLIFPAAANEFVREKNSSFEISLQRPSIPGLYLVILETKGEVMVKKISVN